MTDHDAALREAARALQSSDGVRAAALIRPVVAAQPGHAQAWMMLGEACRLAGDRDGLAAAADAIIALEPRAVRALGWKGDVLAASGDDRAASSFYAAAIKAAAGFDPLPVSLTGEVARIRAAHRAIEDRFAARTDEAMAAAGLNAGTVSPRFAASLDILAGRRGIYLQQPTSYYFPDLPQRAFYERHEFPWAATVEAATDAIRAEVLAAMAGGVALNPYMVDDPDRPKRERHGLVDNPDWSSLHLIENGVARSDMAVHFPATLAAMAAAPLCRIGVRAPTVMVSLLKAGARIPPHHGMINTRLICHLPLVIPGEGRLRVGAEARQWHEGELLIFDDSIEHEAWNDADRDRIVLIFDIWRPELTDIEQAAVAALFDVVDHSE